jgi:hypothetical protein
MQAHLIKIFNKLHLKKNKTVTKILKKTRHAIVVHSCVDLEFECAKVNNSSGVMNRP